MNAVFLRDNHIFRILTGRIMKRLTNNALVYVLLALGAAPAWSTEVEATLQWDRRVELGTLVSGQVAAVRAEHGDRVKKGQALVELDPRGFQVRVAHAEAALEQAGLARDEAAREDERAQELYDRTLLSNRDLELARIAHADARAHYQAAQAELTQAKLDLERSVLRPPFDGIVVGRDVEVGQTVVSTIKADTLMVVADSGAMRARALVSGDELGALAEGAGAAVRTGGRSYDGAISRIALEPVPGSAPAVYEVDVSFRLAGDEVLRAGQSARVVLP